MHTLQSTLHPTLASLQLLDVGDGSSADLTLLIGTVAALIAIILVVAWALRKVLTGAWRVRGARRSLRVIDVLPLGGRRQLAVVRCYDRTFLLGMGDKEVRLVSELDAVIEPAPPARTSTASLSFADLFRRAHPDVAPEVEEARAEAPAPTAPVAPGPEGWVG